MNKTIRPTTANSRIVMGEVDIDVKQTTLIAAALRPRYCGGPSEEIVVGRRERNGAEVFLLEVGDFAVNTFQGSLKACQALKRNL